MIGRIAFVTSFLLASPAFGLLIDEFSDGDVTVEVDPSNPFNTVIQSGLDTGATIGGTRVFALLLNPGQPGDTGSAAVDATAQTLHIQATTRDGFESYTVVWGDATDPSTSLNADLLADGANAFQIDVVAVSSASSLGAPFQLFLWSGFDEGAAVRGSHGVFLPTSTSPYSVRMPFSMFPEVDFRDIDYIGFRDAAIAFSLTLDAIRTVPEPSTLVLLILGLVGVWMRRR